MQKSNTPSLAKMELKNFSVRLGKIFSNISILALILCFCGILSFVATAFILLIGLVIIILTLGTIFVMVPNYWDIMMTGSEISAKISSFFLQNFYIFVIVAIISSIISLTLLIIDKNNKHTARIVVSSVVIGIAIVAIIVFATGGIK